MEEARNDTIKLDNSFHELNNTVQDGLQGLDNDLQDTVYDLNNTVMDNSAKIKGIYLGLL